MVYKYKLYGLKVDSEIKLDELEVSDDHISDILIEVNKEINKNLSDNCFKLSINNVANYYITDGCNIKVQPCESCSMEEVKTFLLGTAMGIILFQRNIIAIHGGSVIIDNRAVIVAGESGAGKSTTVARLIKLGHKFLADDVSAVEEDEFGKLRINPAYPQQRLCRDVMLDLGYEVGKFVLIDAIRNKYIVPSTDEFTNISRPLAAIFYLTLSDVNEVKVEKVEGKKKIDIIVNNIYRAEVLKYNKVNPYYMKKCIQLAKEVDIYMIRRPTGINTVNEVINNIKNTIMNN